MLLGLMASLNAMERVLTPIEEKNEEQFIENIKEKDEEQKDENHNIPLSEDIIDPSTLQATSSKNKSQAEDDDTHKQRSAQEFWSDLATSLGDDGSAKLFWAEAAANIKEKSSRAAQYCYNTACSTAAQASKSAYSVIINPCALIKESTQEANKFWSETATSLGNIGGAHAFWCEAATNLKATGTVAAEYCCATAQDLSLRAGKLAYAIAATPYYLMQDPTRRTIILGLIATITLLETANQLNMLPSFIDPHWDALIAQVVSLPANCVSCAAHTPQKVAELIDKLRTALTYLQHLPNNAWNAQFTQSWVTYVQETVSECQNFFTATYNWKATQRLLTTYKVQVNTVNDLLTEAQNNATRISTQLESCQFQLTQGLQELGACNNKTQALIDSNSLLTTAQNTLEKVCTQFSDLFPNVTNHPYDKVKGLAATCNAVLKR